MKSSTGISALDAAILALAVFRVTRIVTTDVILEKLRNKDIIKATDKVVVVSTAHGLKFTEFKVQYHERKLQGIDSALANPPVQLAPDFGQVVDAINKHFN